MIFSTRLSTHIFRNRMDFSIIIKSVDVIVNTYKLDFARICESSQQPSD